jgi:hypothetical protein
MRASASTDTSPVLSPVRIAVTGAKASSVAVAPLAGVHLAPSHVAVPVAPLVVSTAYEAEDDSHPTFANDGRRGMWQPLRANSRERQFNHHSWRMHGGRRRVAQVSHQQAYGRESPARRLERGCFMCCVPYPTGAWRSPEMAAHPTRTWPPPRPPAVVTAWEPTGGRTST